MTMAPPPSTLCAPTADEDVSSATVPRRSVRLLALGVFLLATLVSPALAAPAWTPKVAVALVLVVPGLVALVRRARARDRAARWGTAFLLWSLVSMLASATPVLSFYGPSQLGNGWLYSLFLVGVWALGREIRPEERRWFVTAVCWAIVLNAISAWVALLVHVPGFAERLDGRAFGLVGNPVQLGGLAAAGIVLVGWRALERRSWFIAVFVVAGALQLSGSRQSLLLMAAGLVYLAWRHRRRALWIVFVALAGVAVAAPLVGHSATGRLGASGGDAERLDSWRAGVEAALHHPVLGSGPGLFDEATSAFRRPGWEGCLELRFTDAHNIFVQQAATVGLVGLALFVAFLIAALRRSRTHLAVFGVLLIAVMLFEPTFVGLTAIGFLFVGLATDQGRPERWGRAGRSAACLGAVAGLVVSTVFLAGMASYRAALALDDASAAQLERADALLPPWPELARQGTYSNVIDDEPKALAWAREEARRDPRSVVTLVHLGQMERRYGSHDAAWAALNRALELDPSVRTAAIELQGLAAQMGRAVPVQAERVLAATSSCPTEPVFGLAPRR